MATPWSASVTKSGKLPVVGTEAVNAGVVEIRAELESFVSQREFLNELKRLVHMIEEGQHPVGLF